MREFRGVWVATVQNVDWPSRRGLSAEEQKAELAALLDRAAALRLNAVVFQVRPSSDAIYNSALEPWSEYVTGQMGLNPGYDPLEFATTEAHRRGLELHAWFNPFRVRRLAEKTPAAANHVSVTHPEWVRTYGHYLWLDPGDKAAREWVVQVISDVVQRYDVDGVHLDDYFYPYVENDAQKRPIPFPDDATWLRYQQGGGTLSRADWRRENINDFVQAMYAAVKASKRWVKVGISPFGIWRPGNPPQIKGLDAYSELYADSRKWLTSGWVDYLAPQLYWPIAQAPQSFPALLGWWLSQNETARHIWPGLFTSRVGDRWRPEELVYQVKTTRGLEANGAIHFSMKALVNNPEGVADALAAQVYEEPALAPVSPWLSGGGQLAAPSAAIETGAGGGRTLRWNPGADAHLWIVQIRSKGQWTTMIFPADVLRLAMEPGVERAAVTGIDRVGVAGPTTVLDG